MDVRYYVKHPNGRERLEAKNDAQALLRFKSHWSAKATWVNTNKPKKRELIKEVRETLHIEEIE